MWKTILDLFTYPGKTIDRILAEKNYMRANGIFFLTMVAISLSAVLSLYLTARETVPVNPWLVTFLAIGPIGGLLFSRFLFRTLVTLGMRIVANREYPRDPGGHSERSRELYLLYPYHTAGLMAPAILLPLVLAPTGHDSLHMLAKLVMIIGFVLVCLGVFAFQITVMVLIVKRVYRVTTAQAFWGPLLAYSLFAALLAIAGLAITLLFSFALQLLS